MTKYFIPLLFLIIFIYAIFKKVKPYDAFTLGAKSAVPFAVSVFPYLVSIFVLTELFDACGLSDLFAKALSPLFGFFGIPKELTKLVLIKPFSGSGSLAVLSEVYATHGADSYVGRCASVIFGSSETVFYVSAVYFSACKNKRLLLPIIISLIAALMSAILACLVCRVM